MIKTISGKQFTEFVIPLIESAQQSIEIVVFDWRWYLNDPGAACQLFNQSIIRAARRNVKVRAILNSDFVINILKSQNCEAKKLSTTRLMHCKLMIIDNKIIITGSHNYTQSAFQTNLELSVILDGENTGSNFDQFFNNLWNTK